MGLACIMYCSENGDEWAPGQSTENTKTIYFTQLLIRNKMADGTMFVCDQALTRCNETTWGANKMKMWKNEAATESHYSGVGTADPYAYASYGMNGYVNGKTTNVYYKLAAASYKSPASKILFGEGWNNDNRTLITPPRYIGTSTLIPTATAAHGLGYMYPVHNNEKSTNVTFMDGHTETANLPSDEGASIPTVFPDKSWRYDL